MDDRIIRDYVTKQFEDNLEDTFERLKFLVETFDESVEFIGPTDVWFCFEEARHSFMVGNFVASIVMCAITIERWLAFLLSIPFYDYSGKKEQQKISDEQTLGKLNDYAHRIGLINDSFHESIIRLNKLRTNFVHGINPNTHKRPQEEHITKFMAENPRKYGVDVQALEEDAKEAILIMFHFYEEQLYLVKTKD